MLKVREMPQRFGRAAAAVLLAASGLPAPAAGTELEEVIVTAQKRAQSLQDVGIAATAFSADDIAEMSMKSIGDALGHAPNIQRSYGPSGTQDAFFFFRGVGQQDVLVVVDPGVAVYIDDVYLGRLQGASLDVLDINRIELLRGPQGTLFGRNTIGGAVSVHTRDPGQELAFNGRVTAGERDRLEVFGTVDVPLTDTLFSSASLYTKQQDGWVTNRDGTTLGDVGTWGARVKMLWDGLDDLTLRFVGDYSDNSDGTPTPQILTAVNPARVLGPLAVPIPTDLSAYVIEDPFAGRADISVLPTMTNTSGGLSLTADWDTGAINIRSITSWRTMEQDSYTDLDGSPYNQYDALFTYDQDQFSQEFQFSGTTADDHLNWLLGGYYFGEDVTGFTGLCIGTGSTALPAPPPPAPPTIYFPGPSTPPNDGRCFSLQSQVNPNVDAYALFANLEYKLNGQLTGILGLRFTDETKKQVYDTATDNRDGLFSVLYTIPAIVQENPFALPGQFKWDVSANNPDLTIPYVYKKSWSDLSPKVGLNYALTDDTLLYLSWSQGFKSGGFGGRATPGDEFQPYDPETISSWEVGVKTEFLDRRVRVNAAAFYSDYEDIQVLVIAEVQGGDNLFITANGGDNRIQGIELELQALLTENVDLSFAAGYIHNEWTSLRTDTEISRDDELPQTPDWTLSSSARYTIPLGGAGSLAVGGDYSYRTDFYFDAENRAEQDAYGVLNMRATYTPDAGPYSLSVYGLNVLNEEFFLARANNLLSLGTETVIPSPDSEWGVEFSFDFR